MGKIEQYISGKNRRIGIGSQNNSGIILIVVLWVLVILSMLAIGLARKVKVDLALTKNAIGKIKSRYIAMAGLSYAMAKIYEDNQDQGSNILDTKFQCGFTRKDQNTVEGLFKQIPVGDGHFTISYNIAEDNQRLKRYGFQDEESKVNINGLNSSNFTVLKYLISELGFDDQTAETVASSVIDWIDADSAVFNPPLGAEGDTYETDGSSYSCKNKPFDSIEELMLVKGMTPALFKKMRAYVTVFPRQDNLRVNFETASTIVLKALARSVIGPQTNTGIPDADSLVERIVAFRKGDDGLLATEDDRVVNGNEMGLNATESSIFQAISYYRTQISQYIHVQSKGVDDLSGVFTSIEAVVQRRDMSLVYWHRN